MIFDWKLPAKAAGEAEALVGGKTVKLTGKPGAWTRATVPIGAASAGPITFKPAAGLEIMNVFANQKGK